MLLVINQENRGRQSIEVLEELFTPPPPLKIPPAVAFINPISSLSL